MKEYTRQELNDLKHKIEKCFLLFNRAAFLPEYGFDVDDPVATLNAVIDTRTEIQKKGCNCLSYPRAAEFFDKLRKYLLETEEEVKKKNAEFYNMARDWREKRINSEERDARIATLGDDYSEYGFFIRERNGWVRSEIDVEQPIIIGEIDDLLKKRAILFLAADPKDQVHLHLGNEFEKIRVIFKNSEDFHLELPVLSVTTETISSVLTDIKPEIVHFSGHGKEVTGALCFEDEEGETQPVEPAALAALFKLHAQVVKCVLLNACYTKTQAEAISKHIKYVIGMREEIKDEAALAFTTGFYQFLEKGKSIDDAYQNGCVQIQMKGISGHLAPELIRRDEKTI